MTNEAMHFNLVFFLPVASHALEVHVVVVDHRLDRRAHRLQLRLQRLLQLDNQTPSKFDCIKVHERSRDDVKTLKQRRRREHKCTTEKKPPRNRQYKREMREKMREIARVKESEQITSSSTSMSSKRTLWKATVCDSVSASISSSCCWNCFARVSFAARTFACKLIFCSSSFCSSFCVR